MLTKAYHNSYDVALLFSGDRDYKNLLIELKNIGKVVGIITPSGECGKNAKHLAKYADFHIKLEEDFYMKYWLNPDGSDYVSKLN